MKSPFVSSSFHERELMTCCLDYDRQLGNIPVQKMEFFARTAAGVEFLLGNRTARQVAPGKRGTTLAATLPLFQRLSGKVLIAAAWVELLRDFGK